MTIETRALIRDGKIAYLSGPPGLGLALLVVLVASVGRRLRTFT
jgi:hypothetical protein